MKNMEKKMAELKNQLQAKNDSIKNLELKNQVISDQNL